MDELQAVLQAVLFQCADDLEDLGDEQAELGFLARGLAPPSRAFAGELDAHAEARSHLVLARMAQDQLELAEVLDHGDDGAAQLRGEDDGLDVAVVLEAVADDHALRLGTGHRHHCEQLRLRADLESETELASVAVDLLDDEALLVDLDREDGRVVAAVVVLRDRRCERIVQPLQPVPQDVRETDDHGRGQVAGLEAVHDLEQVDLVIGGLIRTYHDVTVGIDSEVAAPPGLDSVEVEGILDLPAAATAAPAGSIGHARRAPR